MERLNKEFLAFANGQAHKNPSVSWEAAVQDYLKYASEIASKHPSTKPVAIGEAKRAAPFSFGATPAPAAAAAPSSSAFSVGGSSASNKKDEEPVKAPASSGFSFRGSSVAKKDEAAKSPAKPSAGGFSFGGSSLFSKSSESDEKAVPAFSFGGAPKPAASSTPAATSGFSFGNLTAAKSAAPASTGFSFGASAPAASTAQAEDEENVGREEATVILKVRCPAISLLLSSCI
jgi:hypothetical protein